MLRVPSPLRAGVVTLACVALAAAASSVPARAGAVTGTRVRVAQQLCRRPTPGERACDAIRLVTRELTSSRAGLLESQGRARPMGGSRLGSGPAGGYTPRQLARAYGVDPASPTHETVAIVDAFHDPSVRSDLDAFDAHYGFPRETRSSLRVVDQHGRRSPLPAPDEGWAGEITLDVQTVRAVCHSCRILLVEADSAGDRNLAAAVNQAVHQGADIVSNSYGGPERPADPAVIRRAYDHRGVAILASAGDSGWDSWDNANLHVRSGNAASAPASYSSVVGVGGTSLYLDPDGTRASEQVWNDDGPGDLYGAGDEAALGYDPGAAGSGCSHLYAAPRWQRSVSGYHRLGCGATKRSSVDVAADADEFTGFDIYETFDWCTSTDPGVCPYPAGSGGWATYGGTSLASPLVAALWGLAGGPHGVARPSLTLYGNATHTPGSTYDVRVGGTGGCGTLSPRACSAQLHELVYGHAGRPNPNTGPAGRLDCAWAATGRTPLADRGQCEAEPGYDGVSGVGTPRGLGLFASLGPTAVIADTSGVRAGRRHVYSAGPSQDPFPGGSLRTYSWSWGDGHRTTTSSPTAIHAYRRPGLVEVTLTVTDRYGRSGSSHTEVTVHRP